MQTFMYFESIDYTKMMGKGGILLIFLYWDKAQSMKPWPRKHEVLS